MQRLYSSNTLTLGPGETTNLPINASEYIACVESNLGRFQVGVNDGPLSDFAKGFEVRSEGRRDIQKLRISNPSTVALTVTMVYGSGKFTDRRNLSNVPQGLKPVTIQDVAETSFTGIANTAGSGTGETSHHTLVNPAERGKLVLISFIRFSCTADAPIIASSVLEADVLGTELVAEQPPNYFGQPNSSAPLYNYKGTATIRDVEQRRYLVGPLSAGVPIVFDYRRQPLVIPPGWGFAFGADATEVGYGAVLEFAEVDGA